MAAHMARSTTRRREAGILAIALGVGVLAFGFLGSEDPKEPPGPDRARSITSGPSVLGAVITPDDTPPTAGAASPATFDIPARRPSTTGGSVTTVATTEAPSATLIPPTEVENTTTTTERPPPTSIDLSTTTTDPSTTSTEGPTTTTEPPAP